MLASYCKTLRYLEIGWCQSIDEESVVSLCDSCPNLLYLGLMRCDKLSDESMDNIVERYPNIHFSTMLLDCKRILMKAHSQGFRMPSLGPPPHFNVLRVPPWT